jgi:hypothetical protein
MPTQLVGESRTRKVRVIEIRNLGAMYPTLVFGCEGLKRTTQSLIPCKYSIVESNKPQLRSNEAPHWRAQLSVDKIVVHIGSSRLRSGEGDAQKESSSDCAKVER